MGFAFIIALEQVFLRTIAFIQVYLYARLQREAQLRIPGTCRNQIPVFIAQLANAADKNEIIRQSACIARHIIVFTVCPAAKRIDALQA